MNERNEHTGRLDAVHAAQTTCTASIVEDRPAKHKPKLELARRKSRNDRDISERNRKYKALR